MIKENVLPIKKEDLKRCPKCKKFIDPGVPVLLPPGPHIQFCEC